MIHIIIPHFRAWDWLKLCVGNLTSLSDSPENYRISILDMSGSEYEQATVATYGALLDRYRIRQFDYQFNREEVGGHPLPGALTFGVNSAAEVWKDSAQFDITLLVDPDAVVLAKGWDTTLLQIFADPKMVCAGINPRSDNPHFADVPEWNWMAFRTAWWRENVKTFQYNRVDIGHLFTDAAARCPRCGWKVYHWPLLNRPFVGRGATVCGLDKPFVFHAFYSSRKRLDASAKPEQQWWLTDEEERMAREYCRTGVFPCPDAPPQMFPSPEVWPGVTENVLQ